MATWITHLMIADGVLKEHPNLDKRGFCVGNIAPDCNVENEDWSAFTPSREVTHWMRGERKIVSDCEAFCEEYILKRRENIKTTEQYAFLLGYYSHLITDASFQAMIRNEERVKAVWKRLKANEELYKAGFGMEENWDSIKKLIPTEKRMRDIYALEVEYLHAHPDSGYLTEILPLKEFPDYIDYLPKDAVVRKIGVMGYIPKVNEKQAEFIALSREEYDSFISDTVKLVSDKIKVLGNIDIRKFSFDEFIGKRVSVVVDRPIGYRHGSITYPINYGYIPGTMSGDGEEQDAYILGVSEPVSSFEGRVIAIIRRKNDREDKLVVVPDGMKFNKDEITEAVYFQEQYFTCEIEMLL